MHEGCSVSERPDACQSNVQVGTIVAPGTITGRLFMKRVCGKVLVLFVLLLSVAALHAARLTLFIDGDNRTPYDASRGKAGRAEWTAAVNARKGAILTDNFNGVNIDVPEGKETSVGNFSIFFT